LELRLDRRPGQPRWRRRGSVSLARFRTLVSSLHESLNGKLDPQKIAAGSTRRLWWRCRKGRDHVWQATPNHRSRGQGCPFCAGKRISITNSLARVAPAMAKQWHPKLNGKLTPRDVTTGSDRKVWWQCLKEATRIWQTSIANRVRGTGCPVCYRSRRTRQATTFKRPATKVWLPGDWS